MAVRSVVEPAGEKRVVTGSIRPRDGGTLKGHTPLRARISRLHVQYMWRDNLLLRVGFENKKVDQRTHNGEGNQDVHDDGPHASSLLGR